MAVSANHRHLDPSELGTKDYWDNVYNRELNNHKDDSQDEGTIWFEESNAEEAVLRQLSSLVDQGYLRRLSSTTTNDPRPASRFLDLGTGNGHMLFALLEEDDDGQIWSGELVGVDYSEASVDLARSIAARRTSDQGIIDSPSAELEPVQFDQWDLLASEPGAWLKDGFDVVLDKGTFDAISLMPPTEPHPCETYLEKVEPLIRPGHFLFVTSCNWTRAELVSWLAPESGKLRYFAEAQYPTFTFGGQTGQSVVTVVFQKSHEDS